jgi:hypothetical protein
MRPLLKTTCCYAAFKYGYYNSYLLRRKLGKVQLKHGAWDIVVVKVLHY